MQLAPQVAEFDAERMQQRLRFLADAGLALDVSLDLDETLRRLAGLTVPELAELAVIDLLTPDGSIRGGVAAAGMEQELAEAVERMRAEFPLDPGGAHPVAQVLRSGESLLLPAMSDDELRGYASSPEHFELMTRLRYRSAVVVPLPARGRLLGALSLLRLDERPPFDEHDLLLAQTLGRRAGLTLENARLYQSTRHIARTLQQSLLPRDLPEIPGVRVVGRYHAAAEGQEVGGDFYDAFEITGGCWGIAIGDVCGKGPEAAALTALARYTIRALAMDREPAAVLRLLNDAVRRDRGGAERFLTAVFAQLVATGEETALHVAVAGHPPPFVVRAGGVEQVATRGPLVGVTADPRYSTDRVVLAPGDKLVLYTDGLTDARAPETILEDDDVAALLEAGRDYDAVALAAYLEAQATAAGEPRDDIAILVVESVGP